MTDECVLCGTADFELVDGAMVCLECGTHQINYHELIENEEAYETGRTNRLKFLNSTRCEESGEPRKTVDTSSLDWCTFEAYNIILKNWAEALIDLGASDTFKDALFKLWIQYLQENEIAFHINEGSGNQTPQNKNAKEIKVSIMRKRDFATLRGGEIVIKNKADNEEKQTEEERLLRKIKRKVHNKKVRNSCTGEKLKMKHLVTQEMSDTLNSTGYFGEMDETKDMNSDEEDKFYRANFESQPLMESLDERLVAASIVDRTDDTVDEGEQGGSSETTNTTPHLQLKNSLNYYIESNQDQKSRTWLVLSPYHLTLPKLLSLVYLALLISDENILLLDLIRWCREGHVPYKSAAYLLPEEKKFVGRDADLFTQTIPAASQLRSCSAHMAFFLSLQALPLPSVQMIIDKIASALNLPNDIKVIALRIVESLRPETHVFCDIPPLETLVAAAILLTFKVNFGLDGEHEEILSDWADKLNRILKLEKKEYRLFSWRKWHCYINKVDWWISETHLSDMSVQEEDKLAYSSTNAKQFAKYFWSQGIWFKPLSKDINLDKDEVTWHTSLLNHTLGLNMTMMEKVLTQKKLVEGCNEPRIGTLKQCTMKAFEDVSFHKDPIMKNAIELLLMDFSSDRFNWLLYCYEIVSEFDDFGKLIKIVKVPLNCPSQTYEYLRIAESQSKRGRKPMLLLIPDPMESYWIPNYRQGIKELPHSFRWLLKVLSRLCETLENDIYYQFIQLERKYRTKYKMKRN